MKIICDYCKRESDRSAGHVNRARKLGAGLYCNRTCAGLGRRDDRTAEQKKEDKRLYHIAYRAKNLDEIKIKKRERFQRDYDPVAAAVKRKETMPRHIEYCRTPEYKAWKQKYDEEYRAKKLYGEFWMCFLIVASIQKEVDSRMTSQEIATATGTLNKSQTRRRNYERAHSNKS